MDLWHTMVHREKRHTFIFVMGLFVRVIPLMNDPQKPKSSVRNNNNDNNNYKYRQSALSSRTPYQPLR